MRIAVLANLVVGLSLGLLTSLAEGQDAGSSQPGPRMPESLRRAIDARRKLVTGELTLECTRELPSGPIHTTTQSGRFAGANSVCTDRGDRDGVVVLDTSGAPAKTSTQTPRSYLRDGDKGWIKEEGAKGGEMFPTAGGAMAPEWRALGLSSGTIYAPLEQYVERELENPALIAEYSETADGAQRLVTACLKGGGEYRWWIDPARGWSVTRCQFHFDGRLSAECRVDLGQFDGVWFPARVRSFRGPAGQQKETEYVIRTATFNRPEHAQRLTPETIGIIPNETPLIGHVVENGMLRQVGSGFYDGQGFVTFEEHLSRRKAAREAAGGGAATAGTVGVATGQVQPRVKFVPESEWEAYTRKFIETHKLDEGQRNAALAILKDCQERGRSYVDSRRERFEQLEKDKAGLGKLSGEERTKRTTLLDQRERDLRRPIDQIFERQLKPRLEKLLTARQREAAQSKGE